MTEGSFTEKPSSASHQAASTPLNRPVMVASARPHRRLEAMLVALALGFMVWFYYWTVDANSGFDNWGDMDYYRLLVRGWKKGHLHLDKEPSPELLALADPYDPAQNGPHRMGDASLYRNHYYIYFGPAPAFTLMLPWSVITGRELTMGAATFVFCSLACTAASLLWLAIRRRYFPTSGWWTAPLGVLVLGFGTHLLALAQRPMFWELPISSGIAFTLLAVGACYAAIHGRRPLLAMSLAGLCLGLAVGSRPTCLFATGMLVVPLALSWRERDPRRVWWRMAIAAALPLGICGLALMAHNYARFENPLEWGQNYQLSGAYESKLTHFSARFFPHNFRTYFFFPLQWEPEFPFAKAVGVAHPGIADYFGTEEVSGLAATFPFFWFLLALPLAWWRRERAEAWVLSASMLAIAVATLPVMVLVLCYFSTTMRYETDFAVGLGVLALTGMLAAERWAAATRIGARLIGPLAVAACVITVFVGALVSFDYHGRSMHRTAPLRWAALRDRSHGAVSWVGQVFSRMDGPQVLKVRFKARPAGTVETFWQPADARADERVLVEHIGDHLLRFGYARGNRAVEWGRPLRWEDNHTHTVEVQVPSLYGPANRSWIAGVRRTLAFHERTTVALWFSGGRALGLVTEPWPADIAAGGSIGRDFSGELRKTTSRLYRADEIPSGLVDPGAPRGGVLRMHVVFPQPVNPEGEPLFAAGAHYRSSIVFVQPAKDGLKFVFENYWSPAVESAVFQPSPGGHLVELEMATFRPETYGQEATGDVVVRLDDHEMIRTRQVAYPFAWGDEQIGANHFGTTCAAEFTGWILDAKWVRR